MPEIISVPEAGTVIPDLPLTGGSGSSTLHDVLGGERAVVFFMRSADCAICAAHAKNILRMKDAGELGEARFVLIAPGGASSVVEVRKRIASPGAEVWASGDHHSDVGLGKFLSIQHSGTFVVDAGGRILSRRTSTLPMASFSKNEVMAALR
jgi:peroxiredoxin